MSEDINIAAKSPAPPPLDRRDAWAALLIFGAPILLLLPAITQNAVPYFMDCMLGMLLIVFLMVLRGLRDPALGAASALHGCNADHRRLRPLRVA